MSEFTIKDSGARQEFDGGMVRDTTEGKIDFLNVRFGPMLKRWAAHLTKGREKYPDPEIGTPNWTLAQGPEELYRARSSAARHFEQWLAGDVDEDHAAAVYFNINLAEYVRERMVAKHEGTPIITAPPGALRSAPGGIVEMTAHEFQRLRDFGTATSIDGRIITAPPGHPQQGFIS